jgi:dTDP-4-dehydrorhamnose 3,5-epimerase
MINGVMIKELRSNADERGALTEILRNDDKIFEGFGQAYVSMSYPGVVHAWHYHKKQDDHVVVVSGMCKLVLYDDREMTNTRGELQEVFLGEMNNLLVRIPAGVLHGYKTIGVKPSITLNFPTESYDRTQPDEFRLPWDSPDVPYDWEIIFR